MDDRKKKIRILHAVGMMNRGGAETMLMNIFRSIDRDRFEFAFITHSLETGAYDHEIKQLGGTIHYIPSLGTLGYLRYIMTLRRFILDKGPFDIVHSHLDWQGGAIAAAARFAGVKNIIVHSHSSSWQKPDTLLYRLLHSFNRFIINAFASEGWACSQEAGEFLFSKRFLESGKFRKIRNAIDLDRYRCLNKDSAILMRRTFGIPEGTLVLGHVGSFSKPKNHRFLIQIASELKNKSMDFRLLFVGDGILRKEVTGLVNSYKLDEQVIFLGLRDDIPECMNMFDAFLFPSLFEGLGIAAVEAQAAGIPCLVSERVPHEIDMGLQLVEHLSLSSKEQWIAAIANIKKRRCVDRALIDEKIIANGYNIHQSITEITSLYELMFRKQ
jgi:glycosyltransferase EpsF